MDDKRYKRILGLDEFAPTHKYVCFLPWVGEFGWYIMNHVKRIHGYNHQNKIVCIKPGHECLFPTASEFFYDWADDRPDWKKAGPNSYGGNAEVKAKIRSKYGKNVKFLFPEETSWQEKLSLAHFKFVPEPKQDFGLKVDIVITPRRRTLERVRNYQHWQKMVNAFHDKKWTVGIIGRKESSYDNLVNIKHKAWDYTDVDSDVEMIRKSRVVVAQESGMAYLAMLCRKRMFVIDRCHKQIANKHRTEGVFFKEFLPAWGDPLRIIPLMESFMQKYR